MNTGSTVGQFHGVVDASASMPQLERCSEILLAKAPLGPMIVIVAVDLSGAEAVTRELRLTPYERDQLIAKLEQQYPSGELRSLRARVATQNDEINRAEENARRARELYNEMCGEVNRLTALLDTKKKRKVR
jgi:hypothetical protein